MIQNPTTCLYLGLAPCGTVTSTGYAWDDPQDRNGDGETELEAHLEACRNNGYAVMELPLAGIGPGIPANVGHNFRVFHALRPYPFGGDDVRQFALAIVPTETYWDRALDREIDTSSPEGE